MPQRRPQPKQKMKRTPIYEIARQAGATFRVEAGWNVIESFSRQGGTLVAGQGVGLADRSARTRIRLQGVGVEALLRRWRNLPPLAINEGAPFGAGHCYRLRHDLYFLSLPPGAATETVAVAEGQIRTEDGLITITDVTHGQAELWLVGPLASRLLSRLCGLDFHPHTFPDLTAKESSVAKTQQLLIRRDLGPYRGYVLIGARSLGAYLWQTIEEAGHDLSFALLDERALVEMEGDAL